MIHNGKFIEYLILTFDTILFASINQYISHLTYNFSTINLSHEA